MPVEETPAAAVEPTATSTAAVEPTATEPTAPEPVAAEPTPEPAPAPEPAAEAPAFPGADTFGWDEWDGTADLLPEQLRDWYTRFDERYNKSTETLKLEHGEALERQEAMASQWKRMYEASYSGEDDPRIAEYEEKLGTYDRAFSTYKEERDAEVKAMGDEVEAASTEYFDLVQYVHADFFETLTPENRELLTAAVEHLPLHKAVEYVQMGEDMLQEAVKMAQEGGSTDIIDRIIKAEKAMASKGSPPRKAAPASRIVTGAAPTETPTSVPETAKPQDRQSRIAAAARNAIALERRAR